MKKNVLNTPALWFIRGGYRRNTINANIIESAAARDKFTMNPQARISRRVCWLQHHLGTDKSQDYKNLPTQFSTDIMICFKSPV